MIEEDEFGCMHQLLGEPLSGDELHSAFKAMDTDRSGEALGGRSRHHKPPTHDSRHAPRAAHTRAPLW